MLGILWPTVESVWLRFITYKRKINVATPKDLENTSLTKVKEKEIMGQIVEKTDKI